MKEIKRFLNEQTGVTSIEYALIAALIAVVIAGAVGLLGVKVQGLYQSVLDAFP
ncbi:MAG: Flp family type IVb pilin [Proteobacteria bacterium]|nr:Flp family type IVb pilin [Pseudomonadota bacterium]